MSHIAIQDALKTHQDATPVPLLLAGPEATPGHPSVLEKPFIEYLTTQSGVKLDQDNSRIISTGRTGILVALELAMKYLFEANFDTVLIGGVDSYHDHELLLRYDEQMRIQAEDRSDGFVPGEAAGFILLSKQADNAIPIGQGRISLSAPGFANEAGHMFSDAPYTGDGLAQAVQTALTQHNGQKINKVYSSMNGEHFWAKEHGVAMLRNQAAFDPELSVEHPADCIGDVGGATGAVLIGLAGQALSKAQPPQSYLVTCSSDQGYRAAVCVNRAA